MCQHRRNKAPFSFFLANGLCPGPDRPMGFWANIFQHSLSSAIAFFLVRFCLSGLDGPVDPLTYISLGGCYVDDGERQRFLDHMHEVAADNFGVRFDKDAHITNYGTVRISPKVYLILRGSNSILSRLNTTKIRKLDRNINQPN